MPNEQENKIVVRISNEKGLHARAAAKFVKRAQGFNASIEVYKDDHQVSGQSMMDLLMLVAEKGSEIVILAKGIEAKEALESLRQLIEEEKFQEE